jgi:GNAT superfamily N-acetyltransferase
MLPSEKTIYIHVPDAPQIPGLVFRGFQGESDFLKMAAVIQGCIEVDQSEEVETAEDLANEYAHLVHCDSYQDMLFAEMKTIPSESGSSELEGNQDLIVTDGKLIGYSRVLWFDQSDGLRIYQHIGCLLPEWRRKGIGRAMLRYNQQRLREIARSHPGDIPRVFESYALNTEISATTLLLDEGYTAARHFFLMVRPDLENIPEAPMPEGLEVRPVQTEHLQAIWNASLEAVRDHWGFSEEMETTLEQIKADRVFDPSLWRVAWDGDQVAGMVLSYIDPKENEEYNRKRGWTENIGVRRPWRRRGLARSLLAQSLHAVKERGMTEAALGVDTQNLSGALRLYESVGFRPIKCYTIYQKPFD